MAGIRDNLRYLLWRAGIPRDQWVQQLASWTGCYTFRATELLHGAEPQPDEQERLAEATGTPLEDLRYGDFLAHADVLHQNVRHLIDSLGRGGQKQIADDLGVHVTTVSRWYKGLQRPERAKILELRQYFGLLESVDLTSEPLFLSPTPVTTPERKKWLRERIDHLGNEDIAKLYPALERLLGEQ